MSRFSLRTRVAAIAAVAILLAVALAGVLVQFELGRQLRQQLDAGLHSRAADIALVSISTPALLHQPGVFDSTLSGVGLQVEVVDSRGRIVDRSLSLQNRELPVGAAIQGVIRSGRAQYVDATLGGEQLRVYMAPLPAIGGGPAAGGAVVVAEPTEQVDDTLRRVRDLTVLGAVLAAAIAGGLALLLTGRVLAPLQRLATDAAEVERTADPSRRLSGPDGGDEVAALTRTLNGMLATLERARQSERQFLADASHELRTPLTAARGNAAYLSTHTGDAGAAADLEADLARLSELVDALLASAREDAAAPPSSTVSVDAIAREFAGQPDVTVSAAPAQVRGDADAIRRAILNLIENARRYGPAGEPVELTVTTAGGEVAITVADRGAGLPVELEQAVRRFWRGPNSAGVPGSGLGLALVAATAQRHDGSLRADGARFTIALPALKPFSESPDTTDRT